MRWPDQKPRRRRRSEQNPTRSSFQSSSSPRLRRPVSSWTGAAWARRNHRFLPLIPPRRRGRVLCVASPRCSGSVADRGQVWGDAGRRTLTHPSQSQRDCHTHWDGQLVPLPLPLLTPGGILIRCASLLELYYGIETGIRIFGTHFGAIVQSNLVPPSQNYALVWLSCRPRDEFLLQFRYYLLLLLLCKALWKKRWVR